MSQHSDLEKAKNAGADAYMVKPFNINKVEKKLKNYLTSIRGIDDQDEYEERCSFS